MSRRIYQRTIPTFIVSVCAGVIIAQYFAAPNVPLNMLKGEVVQWGIIVSGTVMVYSQVVLMMMHGRRLLERKETRKMMFNSAVFIITLVGFLITGIVEGGSSGPIFSLAYLKFVGLTATGIMLVNLSTHADNAFRVFSRINTFEAVVYFVCFAFTIFREMTLMVFVWKPFGTIGDWIIGVPNVAAQRAAVGAAGVGAMVLGIRALVGKEPGLVEAEMVE